MTSVIVDLGTSSSRIGTAGDAAPSFEQGREAAGCAVWASQTRDYDFVDRLLGQSKLFDMKSGSNTDVLVAESVWEVDPLHHRLRMCEVLFEKRNAASVCFQYAPVLTCFANARQSALVVDISGGGCTATAVLDGWCSADKDKVERSELGGERLDGFFAKVNNAPVVTKQVFNQLATQKKNREAESYTLPDGTPISQRVCDLLFDPEPLEDPASMVPLHEMVFTAAMKQSPSAEMRRSLMNNIVVCGGLSRTEGLVVQLTSKLNELGKMQHPRVICCGPPQRHLTSWIGGSILASLPVFKELGMTKQEFQESGQDAILKRFAQSS